MKKSLIAGLITMAYNFSLLMLASCPVEIEQKTEEEHLEIITKKLQAKYFKPDGSPKYYFVFYYYDPPDSRDPNDWVQELVPVDSFDVEILYSFDYKSEHFLITHKPSRIGYDIGTILDNEYYIARSMSNSNNPFEEKGIEKGNRYYMRLGASGVEGLAFKKNGAFVDLITGHIFTQAEIEKRLTFLRSKDGIRLIKGKSSLL